MGSHLKTRKKQENTQIEEKDNKNDDTKKIKTRKMIKILMMLI